VAYLVETYFDAAIDAPVRALWDRLNEAGVSDSNLRNNSRPHLTMGTTESLDADAFVREMAQVAQAPAFPIRLHALGAFTDVRPVVFLAPTPSLELLKLHRDLCAAVERCGGSVIGMHAPGNWIPHVSLARRLRPEQLPEAVAALQGEALRLDGRVVRIGLLRDRPIVDLHFESLAEA